MILMWSILTLPTTPPTWIWSIAFLNAMMKTLILFGKFPVTMVSQSIIQSKSTLITMLDRMEDSLCTLSMLKAEVLSIN